MLPISDMNGDLTITNVIQESKTYKLSEVVIQGMIDGLGALEQTIYKMLNTEKYEYPIYSFEYGIELENLIGKEQLYVKAELKRRITEGLLEDDRIESVENFDFQVVGDQIFCTFDVSSIYGDLSISKEVSY